MAYENRPIIFTITSNDKIRISTTDARVEENNREIEFNSELLFSMMSFIAGVYNNQGFAVLFEVD